MCICQLSLVGWETGWLLERLFTILLQTSFDQYRTELENRKHNFQILHLWDFGKMSSPPNVEMCPWYGVWFPKQLILDDRQARFRALVGADRFASNLPYMWFLRRLWKVLLIECCNVWTWNTTFTHGLRSLAWLPDKIEWVERDDGVCVIASQPFLNLHSEHFKVKTKEMLLPDKWWSSLRADASRSNQQM